MRFDPELMPRRIIRGMVDIQKANEVHPKAGSVVVRGGGGDFPENTTRGGSDFPVVPHVGAGGMKNRAGGSLKNRRIFQRGVDTPVVF